MIVCDPSILVRYYSSVPKTSIIRGNCAGFVVKTITHPVNITHGVLLSIVGGSALLYLRKLLDQLGFAQQSPTPVYEDTTACIRCENNIVGGRERAKLIDTRKHFAHEVIQNGEMWLVRVPTSSQLVDILTKAFTTRIGRHASRASPARRSIPH